MIKNDLILRAARGEETERTPVWLMRQAGRILKEYRDVRASVSGFKKLVETPELAAEVTIQPVDILGVDAAIIFSDILVIPEAMGLPYEMIESKGPHFPDTVKSEKDVNRLRVADPENLAYVFEAIKITKRELDGRVPLIGFAGAPWTILAYMIEGGGSKTFSQPRKLIYTDPDLCHLLLDKITESTIGYLKGQVAAGVDMLQIFDSWAGLLGRDQFEEFSVDYMARICDAINDVPITVFAKGASFGMEEMRGLNCQTIGLDWTVIPERAKRMFFNKTLQGNMDPCVLYSSRERIRVETKLMLDQFDGHSFIANLGHGVYPDTDPEKVKIFVEAVKEFSS